MKNILLVISLLTLAWVTWGEAGANDPLLYDGKCHYRFMVWQPTNGKCENIYDGQPAQDHATPLPNYPERQGPITLSTEPDPCLAKMEAAMRLMDGYIARAPWQPKQGQNREQIDEDFKQDMHNKYEAFKAWDDVKRDCWKGTP